MIIMIMIMKYRIQYYIIFVDRNIDNYNILGMKEKLVICNIGDNCDLDKIIKRINMFGRTVFQCYQK